MADVESAAAPPRRELDDVMESDGSGSHGGSGTHGSSGRGVRLGHTVLLAITLILQWLARDYLDARMINASPALRKDCGELEGVDAAECHAAEVLLRVSLGTSLFFAALTALTVGVKDATSLRGRIHNGCWLAKAVVLIAIVCTCVFWMPAAAANAYGQVARVGGGAFLLFQWIVMLATIYGVNDWLLRDDVWDGAGRILLPLGTLVVYGAGLALVGFAFHVFAPSGTCSLNIAIMCIVLILGITHALLSMSSRVEHAGIFTSACVFAYMAFLAVSALGSQPDGYRCNTLKGTDENGKRSVGWSEVVSFLIAFGTIFVTAFTSGGARDAFKTGGESSASDEVAQSVLEEDRPTYSYSFTHFALMLSSMYGSMLLLSWELGATQGEFSISDGWTAMWVQAVSGWLGGILYLYSLAAPMLFPDRTFV